MFEKNQHFFVQAPSRNRFRHELFAINNRDKQRKPEQLEKNAGKFDEQQFGPVWRA